MTGFYAYSTKTIADSDKKNVEITKKTSKTLEETMMHQAILEFQKNYRSPDMGCAIRTLWDLYDESADEIKTEERYNKRIKLYKINANKKKFEDEICKTNRIEIVEYFQSS